MANFYDTKYQSVGLNQQFMDQQRIQMHRRNMQQQHQQQLYHPNSAIALMVGASHHRINHPHLYQQQQYQPMRHLSGAGSIGLTPLREQQQKPRLQSSLFFNKTLSLLHNHAQTSRLQNLATEAATTSRALETARKKQIKNQSSSDKEFGCVDEPTSKDVLLGRGGRSNHHAGNERFRDFIRNNKDNYNDLPKHEKIKLSRAIVKAVHDLGGRFLEVQKNGACYEVVPTKRAVEKTSQCLREKRDGRGESKAAMAAARAVNMQSGTTSKAA